MPVEKARAAGQAQRREKKADRYQARLARVLRDERDVHAGADGADDNQPPHLEIVCRGHRLGVGGEECSRDRVHVAWTVCATCHTVLTSRKKRACGDADRTWPGCIPTYRGRPRRITSPGGEQGSYRRVCLRRRPRRSPRMRGSIYTRSSSCSMPGARRSSLPELWPRSRRGGTRRENDDRERRRCGEGD